MTTDPTTATRPQTDSALGKIIFISGPSGVGKGTLIDALRQRHPDWVFPPSCTTRPPRPGEVDGETYFFITQAEFDERIAAGQFLEYAEVHGGNRYGTLHELLVTEGVEAGKTVIREFDVQGYLQAKERLPRAYYASIFLAPGEPPATLAERIRARAPITEAELAKRLESMQQELALAEHYDTVLKSYDGQIDRLVTDAETLITQLLSESPSL